jgi:hypothetical protein
MDAMPKGTHMIMVYPGGQSTRYNVDPNYAAMIAAGRVAEDAICNAIHKASELKTTRIAMTQAEIDAWENLVDVWGDNVRTLNGTSVRDMAEAGVKAMQVEADKLMQHASVRQAYDQFLLVCKLASNKTE